MKRRLASAVLVMTSAWASSSMAAQETLPASVYARAEAVIPQHVGKLIHGTSVRPSWIGESSRFHFQKRTPEGSQYFLVDPKAGTMQPVDSLPAPRNIPPDQGVTSPDGAWRAFVRDGNLFVVSTRDGREKQLTTNGSHDAPYATPVMNPKTMIAQGTTKPVVEPALSWSPDSRRIATFQLNLQGARRLALVQSTPPNGAPPKVYEYVYPLTGDSEVPLARGVFFEVETGRRVDMTLAPEPMLYYLAPEFHWNAAGTAVFGRVTERGYKALQLYRIEAATGDARLLSEDRSDTYVDYWSHFWCYDAKSDTIYWTSDRTGFLHLYAIDARTGARRQLTSGDWRVRSVAGIDQAAGKLLIVATGREAGRDPYLRHLYAVPKQGGTPKLLTPEPLDHDVSVSPDGRFFVDNMSLINVPTRSVLRRSSDGRIVMELGRANVDAYLAAGYRFPEPFQTLAADGKTPIYGALYKPADFDPGKRYPIIEEIYTGPHMFSQTPKSFEAAMTTRGHNSLAQLGLIAITIDGRGVAGRSRAFQQPSYQNLHEVGLDDHIAGICAIAAKNPWMDISRVGIHGYSAGGYDVVRALTRRPDFYKVGLSGSGVHDNRLDKAWWNEQWMGAQQGPLFDANSNIEWASKLQGKLLVAHGELDENVPPANSLRLVDALIRANKDFEMLSIPNVDHRLETVPYFHRRRWDFFVKELLGKTPPQGYQMKPFEAPGGTALAASETARLNAWLDAKYEELLDLSPMTRAYAGDKKHYDKIDELSEAAADRELEWRRKSVEELKARFDRAELPADAQLSYDLWIYQYEDAAALARFRRNVYVFNQLFGPHTRMPQFLMQVHRVDEPQDMAAYIARIGGVARAQLQLLEIAKRNAEAGSRVPRFAYEEMIPQARTLITGAPFGGEGDSAVWSDVQGKIKGLLEAGKIDADEADMYRNAARSVLLEQWLPVYQQLIAWFESEVPKADAIATGVGKNPNGKAFYEAMLASSTTTSLTPDQVHQIGLDEVARIKGEMEQIKERVGFKGTLQEFFKFVREDDRFYYPNTDEGRQAYIDTATAHINFMKQQLPKYFGILPKADVIVKRVEPYREIAGAPQHYYMSTPDGSRPGVFYAHLLDMRAMPIPQLEVIAYHEALPGHHMNFAIARELTDIPNFRKYLYINAFQEGWGLYTEKLAKEMGAYQDPYSDFGRLTTEIWRAIRLVLDTGLHWKGWTEEQAVRYFLENSPAAEGQVRAEVRRYIVMPGQATGYKIGMLKIEELRRRAEQQLGDRFDIRGFHDTILGRGQMTLDLLDQRINQWIGQQQAR